MALDDGTPSAGALLREWRERRRLTQRELALQSAVSAWHLSFIETGRARASREMLLHLAERDPGLLSRQLGNGDVAHHRRQRDADRLMRSPQLGDTR
jgi:transcriptional regulator with XRE-family HTH domain